MPRTEHWPACIAALVALLGCAAATAADSKPQPLRFEAPIMVARSAGFIALPLPAAAYARSEQRLADLRVVDSRDERVPFALLAPRRALETSDAVREAVLYPLPPAARGTSSGGAPALPVDVVVDGDRISVHRRALPPSSAELRGPSPGWLFDTGERRREQPPVRRLRLRWPAADAEFTAGFRVDSSDDLRSWRHAGVGQLIALRSPGGPLTQPLVELSAPAGRFVRLLWIDPQQAPVISGAGAITPGERSIDLDAATEVRADAAVDRDDPRALVFDLGAVLPIDELALHLGAGTRVVPARLQVKSRLEERWRELGGTVFSRFESGDLAAAAAAVAATSASPSNPASASTLTAAAASATTGASPPFPVDTQARFVRIVVDERVAALEPGDASLLARFRADTLVFASAGAPPYRLLAGSPDAAAGALPAATLAPRLADERPRFGVATLGSFREIEAAAQAAESREREARLRPIALWAVLLVGVALLSLMVWRLARGPRPANGAAP